MTLHPIPRDSYPDTVGIRRTEHRMWFDELPHTAHLHQTGWQVSWMPGRNDLTLDQAHDAMLIAKLSHSHRIPALACGDWPAIRRLARHLGVDPRAAVEHIRDLEQREHQKSIATPAEQIPHLAIHLPDRPALRDRVFHVDAPKPPVVRTPGRVPGQWLLSGEFLDREVQR
ncbi:hypothetical protein [Nocardia goodfellowii]|uniref:Uncharacterized protein n=1 Tax=Nocardia goodfellowii TaxID=882446 RepID=A0ABS4QPW0_9NOCA|nr:hypothetical protein [Nocardia goodfellowii]MBP2193588.1 hypothetical protein [Nocardia goodfellowii]